MRRAKTLGHTLLVVGALALGLLGLFGLSGCSDDPTRPAGSPTDYRGITTGYGGVGTIEVLIAHPSSSSGTVQARATLRLRSGLDVRHLEGVFDPAAGSLTLSGADLTLQGTIANGILRGDGSATGGSSVFIAQQNDIGASDVADYTGVTNCQAGLAIRDGVVVGAAQSLGGLLTFTGSFSAADSSLTLLDTANPSGPASTGQLSTRFVTQAFIRFAFGPGGTTTWTGVRSIGYLGP